MSRSIEVTVDPSLCVGYGMCRELAKGALVAGPDGQTAVADPNAASLEAILEAASLCPTDAIRVTDADTGELLDP